MNTFVHKKGSRNKMRILVVDDDKLSRDLLTMMLSKMDGVEVEAYECGWRALDFITEDIDMAFIDWLMPTMDGLELAGKLRSHPKSGNAHIVLLSANSDNISTGEEFGIDTLLTKPLRYKQLNDHVKKIMEEKR